MRLEQHISLKQSQSLALTPQMQQAIQLLQMSTIELQNYINTQILENPFLEIDSLETVEKPTEDIDPPFARLDEEIYSNYWSETRSVSAKMDSTDTNDWISETVAIPLTLHSYLRQQLYAAVTTPLTIEIGEYLIDLVDEDGYIKADLNAAASELSVPMTHVLGTLSLLQTFDPVGICARNLSECLTIQLRETGQLNEQLETVLAHLEVITHKGMAGLMKQCQFTQAELGHVLSTLKGLSPQPGQKFQQPLTQILIPDLDFKHRHNKWICELNEAALPKIFVNSESYQNLISNSRQSTDKVYINERFRSAKWLEKTILQRAQTMLRVGNFIAQHQGDFLENGSAHLKPMNLKDVAVVLEIHESTIARTVNGKFATTPHGVIELKSLFSASVIQEKCELSNKAIQFTIKELIHQENKIKPLSDDQLVNELKKQGVAIARRTVTKYRETLNIPSSYDRKKQAELMTF